MDYSFFIIRCQELLDEVQVRAVNIANENNLTELPTLIFEFICTGKYVFSCDLLLVYVYSWIKSSILMEGIEPLNPFSGIW